jgi:hypothetical protein
MLVFCVSVCSYCRVFVCFGHGRTAAFLCAAGRQVDIGPRTREGDFFSGENAEMATKTNAKFMLVYYNYLMASKPFLV